MPKNKNDIVKVKQITGLCLFTSQGQGNPEGTIVMKPSIKGAGDSEAQ